MATTDGHAFGSGRYECTGDAQVLAPAEQAVRVGSLEGKAQYGADRTQRDVALLPVNAKTQRFLAFVGAATNDTGVGHRAGVGTGMRIGQGKGRQLCAAGKTRQVMVFLRLGAVMQQQLGRPQ